MGIMDGLETIMTGLVALVIIGGFTVAMFPIIDLYYGNTDVYGALGTLIKALIGLIAVVFMVGLFKRLMDDTKGARQTIRDTTSMFRRE